MTFQLALKLNFLLPGEHRAKRKYIPSEKGVSEWASSHLRLSRPTHSFSFFERETICSSTDRSLVGAKRIGPGPRSRMLMLLIMIENRCGRLNMIKTSESLVLMKTSYAIHSAGHRSQVFRSFFCTADSRFLLQ
jgi:hypothetical protein